MQDIAQAFDTATILPLEHGDDTVLDPSVIEVYGTAVVNATVVRQADEYASHVGHTLREVFEELSGRAATPSMGVWVEPTESQIATLDALAARIIYAYAPIQGVKDERQCLVLADPARENMIESLSQGVFVPVAGGASGAEPRTPSEIVIGVVSSTADGLDLGELRGVSLYPMVNNLGGARDRVAIDLVDPWTSTIHRLMVREVEAGAELDADDVVIAHRVVQPAFAV